jgi:hypothetical protein
MSKRKVFDDDMDAEYSAEIFGDKNISRDSQNTITLSKNDGITVDSILEDEEKIAEVEIERRELAMKRREDAENLFFELQDECRALGIDWLNEYHSFSTFVDEIAPDPYLEFLNQEQQQSVVDEEKEEDDINWDLFNKPKVNDVKHVSLSQTEIAKVSIWGKKPIAGLNVVPIPIVYPILEEKKEEPKPPIETKPIACPPKFKLTKKNFSKMKPITE